MNSPGIKLSLWRLFLNWIRGVSNEVYLAEQVAIRDLNLKIDSLYEGFSTRADAIETEINDLINEEDKLLDARDLVAEAAADAIQLQLNEVGAKIDALEDEIQTLFVKYEESAKEIILAAGHKVEEFL